MVVGVMLLAGGGLCMNSYMAGDVIDAMGRGLESRKDDLNSLYSKALSE